VPGSAHIRRHAGGEAPALCGRCYWSRTALSVTYLSRAAYLERLLTAVAQEVMIGFADPVARFYRIVHAAAASAAAPGAQASTPAAFQSRCRASNVGFYAAADLIYMQPKGKKAAGGDGSVGDKRKRRGGGGGGGGGRGGKSQWRGGKRARKAGGGAEGGSDSEGSTSSGEEEGPGAAGTGTGGRAPPPTTLAGVVADWEAGVGVETAARMFLRFNPGDKERSTAYGLDDVWVVATSVDFGWPDAMPPAVAALPIPPSPAVSLSSHPAAGGGKDDFWKPSVAKMPFVWFARSRFHGPSGRNMLEMAPLAPGLRHFHGPSLAFQPTLSSLTGLPPLGGARCVRVCALRLGNASTDLQCLDVLAAAAAAPPPLSPLIDAMLGTAAGTGEGTGEGTQLLPCHLLRDEVEPVVDGIVAGCRLNPAQAAVVRSCVGWAAPGLVAGPPVTPLVACHGCFGSGKSYMIVALVRALTAVGAVAPGRHLLIAAATNTAVDRVLTGLLAAGFTDFARVGAVKKVHKRLLPHLLPYSDRAEAVASTIADLRDMLNTVSAPYAALVASGRGSGDAHGDEEESDDSTAHIREAIRRLEGERDQLARLKRATVIGVTCAATSFPILAGITAGVVVLDEASQMVEPVSLLPIAKFGARAALTVGDLKQLPPILPRPPLSAAFTPAAAPRFTLDSLTLFDRLAQQGCTQVHLTTQYRCHPALADLASRLFYSSTLTSGVTAAERPPLVSGWSPLCLVDTGRGGEETSGGGTEPGVSGGSIHNAVEAVAVVTVVAAALSAGVEPSQVSGVLLRRLCAPRYPPPPTTTTSPPLCPVPQVGVICLYRAQMFKVADALRGRGMRVVLGGGEGSEGGPSAGGAGGGSVSVCTVDAFQGAEKPLIVVSPCRVMPYRPLAAPASGGAGGGSSSAVAGDSSGTTFISDPRRLNVTITRARNHCVVVGCGAALCTYPVWSDIIAAAAPVAVPGVRA